MKGGEERWLLGEGVFFADFAVAALCVVGLVLGGWLDGASELGIECDDL